MKRLILSALAILGLGTMATEANAQFYVCKDGLVVYKMTSDVPDSITFHKPVFDVSQYNGHDYIDLGLSVKWATVNVGAEKPEDYGDYFAWGETTTKDSYSTDTYKYYKSETIPAHQDADGFDIPEIKIEGYTKYVPESEFSGYGYDGFFDGKSTLDLSDDAANANWGGLWRMPTNSEWDELRLKCTWKWIAKNGVWGYKVTSKVAGYTDKWIFLPASGSFIDDSIEQAGHYGTYLSSSLIEYDYPGLPYRVGGLGFYQGFVYAEDSSTYYGFSVRPVAE